MWLLHMEEMDGCKIMHARNGRKYRLPELPRYSVMVIVQKQALSMNFWDVSGTVVNVSHSVITKQ